MSRHARLHGFFRKPSGVRRYSRLGGTVALCLLTGAIGLAVGYQRTPVDRAMSEISLLPLRAVALEYELARHISPSLAASVNPDRLLADSADERDFAGMDAAFAAGVSYDGGILEAYRAAAHNGDLAVLKHLVAGAETKAEGRPDADYPRGHLFAPLKIALGRGDYAMAGWIVDTTPNGADKFRKDVAAVIKEFEDGTDGMEDADDIRAWFKARERVAKASSLRAR
jgi:hypothetical protein